MANWDFDKPNKTKSTDVATSIDTTVTTDNNQRFTPVPAVTSSIPIVSSGMSGFKAIGSGG